MGLLIVPLLTIGVVCVTFLVSFYKLWHNPPKLIVQVSLADLVIPNALDLSLHLPNNLHLKLDQTHQVVPAVLETNPKEEPIPEDILDYISQESEVHAQDARKRRVRALKVDTGNWDVAFRLLQKEDNSLE